MTRAPSRYGAAVLTLVLALVSCARPDASRFQPLLNQLAQAPEAELPALLHRYSQVSPAAQAILLSMVSIIRAPSAAHTLEIVAARDSGAFTMVVARVPWKRGHGASELQPVLVHSGPESATLAGYVLPFNDIIPLLSHQEMDSAMQLAAWYAETYGASEVPGG